jgi:hypothetical protein
MLDDVNRGGLVNTKAALLLLIEELWVRVLPTEPDRTKVAGIGSGGLFSLPSRVSNCKQIKRLAKSRSESVVVQIAATVKRLQSCVHPPPSIAQSCALLRSRLMPLETLGATSFHLPANLSLSISMVRAYLTTCVRMKRRP